MSERDPAAVTRVSGPLGARGRRLWLIAAALTLAFYLWTVSSSAPPFDFGNNSVDFYHLESDAFLDGKLRLLVKPDPQLLALPNPYDPVSNVPYALHDASLYHGNY